MVLFRLFGIEIKLHLSWWFIFFLIAWGLSGSYFPQILPGLHQYAYWGMGLAAALLLFISVILHELSHSLVARAKKIKVESITLFFFGGVAAIPDEDMKPGTELQMALAGPLFSIFLSALFYAFSVISGNALIVAIVIYLSQLNLTLGLFNLIPGFPLDGGRALRAIIHWYTHDIRKATYIASMGGKIVAGVLLFTGIFGFISGVVNGLWFILLGGFLYFIAGMSYEQVLIKQVLARVPVSAVMTTKFSVVASTVMFADFVEKYAYLKQDAFIVKGKNFIGILDISRAPALPLALQRSTPVNNLAISVPEQKILTINDKAHTAFRYLNESNLNLLPVMQGQKILGVVRKDDVMHCLLWSMKYGFESTSKKAE